MASARMNDVVVEVTRATHPLAGQRVAHEDHPAVGRVGHAAATAGDVADLELELGPHLECGGAGVSHGANSRCRAGMPGSGRGLAGVWPGSGRGLAGLWPE